MTEQQLRDAEAATRTASAAYEAARDARNRLVRQALEQGWSQSQVARAMGLTRGRVGQLAQSFERIA